MSMSSLSSVPEGFGTVEDLAVAATKEAKAAVVALLLSRTAHDCVFKRRSKRCKNGRDHSNELSLLNSSRNRILPLQFGVPGDQIDVLFLLPNTWVSLVLSISEEEGGRTEREISQSVH